MNPGRRYLGLLLHSFGTRVGMTVFRLIRNAIIARILGPEARGLFALISALPELIAAIGSGGLSSALAYNAARNAPAGLLIARLILFGGVVCLGAALVGIAVLQWFPSSIELGRSLGGWVWVVVIAAPLFAFKSGLLSVHNAAGHVREFNHLRLIESLAPLLLFLALFWAWADHALFAAVASWLLGMFLVVLVGLRWLGRYQAIAPVWTGVANAGFLRYSAKTHPDVLFQQLLLRIDFLMIAAMLGNESLGYYAIATAAAELLLIVPESVTTPLMRRLLRQGEGIEALVPMALRVTGMAMLFACGCTALLGEWLILILFGVDFLPAYPALLALLPGVLGLCFAGILRLDLLGRNRGGTVSMVAGAMAILNIALNLVLIPRFGIEGAAIGSSIAYLIGASVLLLVYVKEAGVGIGDTLFVRVDDMRRIGAVLGVGRP
ncbi:MAG: oligosaccharide flippase family protein [Pseudomonadota bacterium]|nr:oligosaccharide flippase family protein [Pseudomonadota bacterium]